MTRAVVDVATGWTACGGVLHKGPAAVFAAVERARARLPFPLLGIDSDNGRAFLNDHLVRRPAGTRPGRAAHLHPLPGRSYE